MERFKIDLNDTTVFPLALYVRRRTLFGWKWEKIRGEETIDDAKAYYAKIKDLPEYLP